MHVLVKDANVKLMLYTAGISLLFLLPSLIYRSKQLDMHDDRRQFEPERVLVTNFTDTPHPCSKRFNEQCTTLEASNNMPMCNAVADYTDVRCRSGGSCCRRDECYQYCTSCSGGDNDSPRVCSSYCCERRCVESGRDTFDLKWETCHHINYTVRSLDVETKQTFYDLYEHYPFEGCEENWRLLLQIDTVHDFHYNPRHDEMVCVRPDKGDFEYGVFLGLLITWSVLMAVGFAAWCYVCVPILKKNCVRKKPALRRPTSDEATLDDVAAICEY